MIRKRPPSPPGTTVQDVIASAVAGEHLEDAHRSARINSARLGRAGFANGAAATESLSGGWKRRLAMARELALQPDLLFLDGADQSSGLGRHSGLEKLLSQAPSPAW